MKKTLTLLFSICLMVFVASMSQAQELKPKPSPLDLTKIKSGYTYIKVVYSRPQKKGREVFGGALAPYGKVWRTGANDATEITLTKDVNFGGKELKAGTYTLFTIPNADSWTIILNNDLGVWGAFSYDEKKDALRVTATPMKTEKEIEAFTITLAADGDKKANLTMMWDNTQVTVPITFK